jgi:hypothetical protein
MKKDIPFYEVTDIAVAVIKELNEKVKTSTLRHVLDVVEPHSFCKIEPIMEDVFGVNNEYWVSFYLNNIMYDKRYVFLAESINESNFTLVPEINRMGVMIK